jgi:predicted DCC family thiol-disulfide oxidoreductase YuxK
MTDDTGSDAAADGTDDPSGRTPDSDGDRTLGSHGETVDPVAVSEEHPVLLFDGVCNLCNWSVQFIIERDPEAQFRFAPLQSTVAQDLLDACEYEGNRMDSVVLVENGECYAKSDAAIRATRYLGLPYSLLRPTGLVPAGLRNLVYDFVANRRYRWFGKRERCLMPTPDIEQRFLAGRPGPDPD